MLIEIIENLFIGDCNLMKKIDELLSKSINVIFTSNYLFNFEYLFQYHSLEISSDIMANNNFYNISVLNILVNLAKKIQKEIKEGKKVYIEFLNSNLLSSMVVYLIINNKISFHQAIDLIENKINKKLLLDPNLKFQIMYLDYLYNETYYSWNYLLEYRNIYYSDQNILLNFDNLLNYSNIYLFTHLDSKIFGFPAEIEKKIISILLDSHSLYELISRAKDIKYQPNTLIITPSRNESDILIQDYNFKYGIYNIKDYASGCSKMEIYYYQTGLQSRKYQIFLLNHIPFPGITPLEYLMQKYNYIKKEIDKIINNKIFDPLDIYKLELAKSLESLSKFNSNIRELKKIHQKLNYELNNLLDMK